MVTREEIESARTPSGGWTKPQLQAWGVPWPPPKGWRERLLAEATGPKTRQGREEASPVAAEQVAGAPGLTAAIERYAQVIARSYVGWDNYDDDLRDQVNESCLESGRQIACALADEGLLPTIVETRTAGCNDLAGERSGGAEARLVTPWRSAVPGDEPDYGH